MKPRFRSHYFDDSEARAAFKAFLREIHGLDLDLWEQQGFWDPDFIPFSFFLEGKLVSNVCLYSLPMTVQGKELRVAQLSSVGTLPAFRRRGLNRELTRRAMAWAVENQHSFTFLFADQEAIPFYQATGFRAAPQKRFIFSPPQLPHGVGRARQPLDPIAEHDRRRLLDLSARRAPVSHLLGHRSLPLLMFHALYSLRDCLSYLPDLDLIVAARRRNETLFIHDLIGPEIPSFELLHPFLSEPGVMRYEFGFVPDRLGLDPKSLGGPRPGHDHDGTHVDARFPLIDIPFRFPFTVRA